MRNFSFTSSSVTGGHPDKLCDSISDAIVDAYLRVDPGCRIEAECALTTGIVFCACHSSSDARVDVAAVARRVIAEAGYAPEAFGAGEIPVMASVAELPAPAAAEATPAGQNITTFGYATAQTDTLMPVPVHLAHQLVRGLRELARAGRIRPDAQAQVTVRFEDRQAVSIAALTLLAEPAEGVAEAELGDVLYDEVIAPALTRGSLTIARATRVLINPAGVMLPGGPAGHSGVTGRKLGVDLYGDFSRQPSSALSGKDPSRVDRIATYAARHAAVNVVAAGLAAECEVQLGYTIGSAEPSSVEVDSFGSGAVSDEKIGNLVREQLEFSPAAISARFELRRRASDGEGGFFEPLAVLGHVGRPDLVLPWEQQDCVARLAR